MHWHERDADRCSQGYRRGAVLGLQHAVANAVLSLGSADLAQMKSEPTMFLDTHNHSNQKSVV